MDDAWADRPWQLTKLLWSLLPSAIRPAVMSMIDFVARYAAHLRKQKHRKRPRKLQAFRKALEFG